MKAINVVKNSFRKVRSSKRNFLSFLTFSFLIFSLSITVPYLDFVFTVASSYGYNFPQLFQDLIANLYLTGGYTAVVLTLIYSILSAALIFNSLELIRLKGVKTGGYSASVIPGFLAGGCAACGASIIPILSFGAASAIFPFSGNLWRLFAILIVFYTLTVIDKQSRTCKI